MAFQWNLIIFVPVLWLTFNIKELECRHPGAKELPNVIPGPGTKRAGNFNKALGDATKLIAEFPYGISGAVDDASGVFANVLGMIFSKKKFLGIESFYYK